MANTRVQSLIVSGTALFAGTYEGGVWMRPLSQIITSVYNSPIVLSDQFSLQQNYPNPFNPNTKIYFYLPEETNLHFKNVKLSVYNALGKEIEVLVNQDLSPGRHDVEFNGEQYPSGIYFYRIIIYSDKSEDEVYIETRYMILLK